MKKADKDRDQIPNDRKEKQKAPRNTQVPTYKDRPEDIPQYGDTQEAQNG
jgi:hypothetical protein